ncbi:MAG TPA: ABC transporter substrate-binding protein [Gaiellaceae bacterium]|nr:ABC transporter substrate-binding protein [Gaiellaceae bacterium]
MRISLTGRVSIEAKGAMLDEQAFPGRQGRLVFAYLLAQDGRPVPRDELADVLWADAPPARWEKALSVLVSKLRGLLESCGVDGQAALRSAFGCYQLVLPSDAWIDVTAAREAADAAEVALGAGDLDAAREAAGEAAALARRSFLPGEDAGWIEEKRRELSELLVRALELLADACLASGDAREAVRPAEELTTLEPYREGGYRRLMQAHAAAGDRAEALRVYERCRRLLADELGAYPSPETESVYRALLLRPAPESGAEHLETVPPSGEPQTAPTPDLRPPPPARRRRWLLAAAGAVVVIGAVAALSVVAMTRGGSHDLRTASPNSVAMINTKTRRLVADIAVGTGPTAVAAGNGFVWVTSAADRSVSRIDVETGTVRQTVRVGDGPSGLAVGAGAVWVANGLAGTVSRVDMSTNEVVQTITVGNSPTSVAFGLGAIWVTNADDRSVSKVDPATGAVEKTLSVDAPGRGIAVGGGVVWVSDPVGNAVVRLDPATGLVTSRVAVGSGPTALAYGFGAVWVANNLDGTVSRVDADRAVVVATIPVGIAPNGISVASDAVWVTDEVAGTVVRVDPVSGVATRHVIGGRPKGAASADGALWVAVQPGDRAHRGGTLRLLTSELADFDLPDPARSYDDLAWSLLSVTGDGLLGFKRVGGVEGTTLVPNLATAIPVPSDGGRSYTFRLREGPRFSNGDRVKASDVRFTLERVFKVSSPGRDFYTSIVGGAACVRRPSQCDLSNGIRVDDPSGTITFRLREPDAEFLHKLALPLAFIVPSGTPLSSTQPVAGTGPYRFERYVRGRLIRLSRNTYFRTWSSAAQPQGLPDAIELRSAGATGFATVQAGEADITDVGTGRLDEMLTRYPAQIHITPRPVTMLVQLNTTRPPFDNPAARTALALAIDRGRLVELVRGSEIAEPTCQVFPPNFPGYRPYCIHTLNPSGGAWTAPDLARAHALARSSGTLGMRVDMISNEDGLFAAAANVVADALERLGYRVSLRTYRDQGRYFGAYGSAARTAEVAFNGWISDYPAPSNFIRGVYGCNPYFCDPAVEGRMRRLLSLQAHDPRAAGDQWAQLERQLVERAIAIPLLNPRDVVFTSRRVGNFQRHPVFGTLISQLWVR